VSITHVTFEDGLVIRGSFPDQEVLDLIQKTLPGGKTGLCIADPPYGNIVDKEWDRIEVDDREFCRWMVHWTKIIEAMSLPGAALYVWGGVGLPRDGKKPPFRPFLRYLVEVELETGYSVGDLITWAKKRAYGTQTRLLFTREECAYLVLGHFKKPRRFKVPYLAKERGYAGYNSLYPARSPFLRRTNVWTDVTELFRGKVHPTQKPERLAEIMIETHTDTGEFVLDPFAGSGSTALAARKLGRRFVLVEQDPSMFDLVVERLRSPAHKMDELFKLVE